MTKITWNFELEGLVNTTMDDSSVPGDNINTHIKGGGWSTQSYVRGVRFFQGKSYSWGDEWGRASYTEDSGHESYKERWIAFKWQNSGKSKTGFPIQSHLGVSVGTICQLHTINKRRIDLLYGWLWNKSVQDIYIYPCMQTHCSTVLKGWR